jgi:hypothetical protein
MHRLAVLSLMTVVALDAQEFTRGIGVYPGNPGEDFSPVLRVDAKTYRNLALRRPAFQSSSYDYNLTAQLVTDGIKDTGLPRWVATSSSEGGTFPKNEREWILDDNPVTGPDLKGPRAWVQVELAGGEGPLEVDRVDLDARAQPLEAWTAIVSGSDDGETWTELGRTEGTDRKGPQFVTSWRTIALSSVARRRHYRVEFDGPAVRQWHVGNLRFYREDARVHAGGPFLFTSAWKSAGTGEEWVYVDLGAPCTFDRIVLSWIRRAAEGSVQVSDDAAQWRTIQALGASGEIKLPRPERGRYVRVLMTRPETAGGYVLGELEVYGRGGLVPQPKPALSQQNGRLQLSGGGWRVQRDSQVSDGGEKLSTVGFDDAEWVVATVPSTILSSYWNAGALPNPNFGHNINTISDSFFYADFWYRNEFPAPAGNGKRVWLNFDGINWKADVFLNGENLGCIEGGFIRGRFDVTGRVRPGQKNALAVRIRKNANPGSIKEKTWTDPDKNGGVLGADNPTFHASIGWDWIPTIRGRNTGIWNDVYLETTGPVTIEHPFVSTNLPLPDTTRADVRIETTLRNHGETPVSGTLRGRFGEVSLELPVTLEASSEKVVKLDPSTHEALRLQNPRLWWPAGYGAPNLYDIELRFETGPKAISDTKRFKAGVREFAYSEEGGALRMWINGRRFIPRGGNWGFAESMLRYRAREYDAAVRYHKEMNFTIIRNWVGQVGDIELYEAADRHGIVIWHDFWLANPWDGPDPDNNEMFLRNARDSILNVRNHASVGLYCGRNEGYPPTELDDGIRGMLADLHPGLHYISSSADDVVTGHGPYRAMPVKAYFSERATPKFHSEMGMPNIVTYDSLREMMPEPAMWPQGDVWGHHDFSQRGAQGGASFRERIDKSYGGANSAEEWVKLAQFVNYEGYRAMFEAQSKNRMGLLIWMSHPTWPSFVWQTYDYYLEPTAAYFGAKKGSEPLHIQWNPLNDSVEVVNYHYGIAKGVTAHAQILNLDGTVQWDRAVTFDIAEDATGEPIDLEYPEGLTRVHFIRLRLTQAGRVLSENVYWRGTTESDYRALRELPKVKLDTATRVERQGSRWVLNTELHNPSKAPALMVRLKPVREKSADRILPAVFSDNYIALMPGERRKISVEVEHADTRGERPRMVVEGFNVE